MCFWFQIYRNLFVRLLSVPFPDHKRTHHTLCLKRNTYIVGLIYLNLTVHKFYFFFYFYIASSVNSWFQYGHQKVHRIGCFHGGYIYLHILFVIFLSVLRTYWWIFPVSFCSAPSFASTTHKHKYRNYSNIVSFELIIYMSYVAGRITKPADE